jgi:putative membrane protein
MLNNILALGYGRGFEGAAGAGYGPGMMGYYWGAPLMMVGMIIMTIVVILGVYLIIRYVMKTKSLESKNKTMGDNSDSAIRILNERFAKGEITEEEYVRMKNNLMS